MALRFIALLKPRSHPQRSLGHLTDLGSMRFMTYGMILTLTHHDIFFCMKRGDPLLQKSPTRDTVKDCLSRLADQHACLNSHAQCSLYVTIFLDPLDEGSAGEIPAG